MAVINTSILSLSEQLSEGLGGLAMATEKLSTLSPPRLVQGASFAWNTSFPRGLITLSPSAKWSNFFSFQTSSLVSVLPENGYHMTGGRFCSLLQPQSNLLDMTRTKQHRLHGGPPFLG